VGAPRPSAYPFLRLGDPVPRGRSAGVPRKSIFDPVHGPIALDDSALALISTPEFQRLWGVRQTGFAHLVFPGANHTRLEHSLGTYWVAGRLAERLELDTEEGRGLELAALLHDLGHAPFSHTLDGPMREVLGHGHEAVSRELILGGPDGRGAVAAVLRAHGADPGRVAELVDPRRGRSGGTGSILHGAIDADRIDYLQRDAHYTGVAHGAIDAVRLLDTIRVLGGRVVFAEKGRSAVEGFLVGRALMYASVYFHKTVRSAEVMAQAAVERQPGFPEVAREQFAWTDGELLTRLAPGLSPSGDLIRGLLARRLYKRAHGWRELDPATHARWRRVAHRPESRRALEDDIAERLGGRPGTVIIDLAGIEVRGDPIEDWADLGVMAGRRVTYPFRGSGPWHALVNRPPADWPVSVYVVPRLRGRAARLLERDPAFLP
jgi:uncharacterized protein